MSSREISASETVVTDFAVLCSCGNVAVAYLEIHAVGFCTPEAQTVSSFKCRNCLRTDMERAQNIILDSGVDGRLDCKSCGLTIVNLSDIVVRVCPLW